MFGCNSNKLLVLKFFQAAAFLFDAPISLTSIHERVHTAIGVYPFYFSFVPTDFMLRIKYNKNNDNNKICTVKEQAVAV